MSYPCLFFFCLNTISPLCWLLLIRRYRCSFTPPFSSAISIDFFLFLLLVAQNHVFIQNHTKEQVLYLKWKWYYLPLHGAMVVFMFFSAVPLMGIFHFFQLLDDFPKCTLHVWCYVPTNSWEIIGWCRWSEQIPMNLVEGSAAVFQRTVDVPPGYHKVLPKALCDDCVYWAIIPCQLDLKNWNKGLYDDILVSSSVREEWTRLWHRV